MTSTYKLNTGELSPDFIATIQKEYPGRDIEIVVRDDDEDTTEYLLRSPANRKHLREVLADIEKGEHLVSVPAVKRLFRGAFIKRLRRVLKFEPQ